MNWISLYIYHNISFEKVLSEFISPFTEYLKDTKEIDRMFFIRYWEGGPHIRFRVLPEFDVDMEGLKNMIVNEALEYFSSLDDPNLVSKLHFEEYAPEVSRYGGKESLYLAENHFHDSSSKVLELVEHNLSDWNYTTALSLALKMHLIFAREVLIDQDQIIRFFEFSCKRWFPSSVKLDDQGRVTGHEANKAVTFFHNSFEKQRGAILSLLKGIWNTDQLSGWMKEWSIDCKKMNELKSVLPDEEAFFSVLDSCVHMTNNRLGIHLRDEAFISYLLINGVKEFHQDSVTPYKS